MAQIKIHGLREHLDPIKGALLALVCLATLPAVGADSVVIGRGVSNGYFAELECEPDQICMDSVYVWELDAKRTVSGPPVTGRVRATIAVHAEANQKFVRSVELFVLRPHDRERGADPDHNRVQYELVALSPRYRGNRYCLRVDPSSVGLDVVSTRTEHGMFCFPRKAVAKAMSSPSS